MNKINYLITSIILTMTLTLYAGKSSTTSYNYHFNPNQHKDQTFPTFVKKIKIIYKSKNFG
jgi:hypothetical protein